MANKGKNHTRQHTETDIQNLRKLGRILKDARKSRPRHENSQVAFARFLTAVTGDEWTANMVQTSEQAGSYPSKNRSIRRANPKYLKAVAPYAAGHTFEDLMRLNDSLYAEIASIPQAAQDDSSAMMRAIEVTGSIDAEGNLLLDEPIQAVASSRVRAILLFSESVEEDEDSDNMPV